MRHLMDAADFSIDVWTFGAKLPGMEDDDRHLARVNVDVELDDAAVASAVTAGTRRSMKGNKGRNTKPQLALRSLLHRAGYLFRIHDRSLPGHPT